MERTSKFKGRERDLTAKNAFSYTVPMLMYRVSAEFQFQFPIQFKELSYVKSGLLHFNFRFSSTPVFNLSTYKLRENWRIIHDNRIYGNNSPRVSHSRNYSRDALTVYASPAKVNVSMSEASENAVNDINQNV